MSGPSTTCREHCTSSLYACKTRYCVSSGIAKELDAKSDKGQTSQRLFGFKQSRYLEKIHITKHTHTRSLPPYLCLSVVSLWVLLETLGIYTDGGAHPATTAAHTKHQSGCIAEDDPQTLERDTVTISCPD